MTVSLCGKGIASTHFMESGIVPIASLFMMAEKIPVPAGNQTPIIQPIICNYRENLSISLERKENLNFQIYKRGTMLQPDG
jgi:hypothetical protein